jgi:hypothetical protein
MDRLELDYRAASARSPAASLVFCALGGIVLVLALGNYQRVQGELETARAQADQLERLASRAGGEVTADASASPETRLEVARANAVIRQLNLPWETLFTALETSHDSSVALLGMTPDPLQQTVKLAAEAKDFVAALEYARRLAASRVLDGIYLQSHEVVLADPQKPVRFTLVGTWRMDGR